MTPRQKIHVQLLRGVQPSPDMFDEVAYLQERGLLHAATRRSKRREDYGRILDVVVRGPTAAGLDYLEQLTAEEQGAQDGGNQQPTGHDATAGAAPNGTKLWHERSTGRALVFTVAAGLLVLFLGKCSGLS